MCDGRVPNEYESKSKKSVCIGSTVLSYYPVQSCLSAENTDMIMMRT